MLLGATRRRASRLAPCRGIIAEPSVIAENFLSHSEIYFRAEKSFQDLGVRRGFPKPPAITVRAVAFSTRGHGTDGSAGGLIAPRVPRIP